jgi:hypothetical protein
VLLGAGGVVKLADFGASKRLHALCTSSLQGTARYIAPEVLRRERVGRQSDIWSVGCCVVEMYSLSLPLDCQYSNDLAFMHGLAGLTEPPPLPPGLPPDAADFASLCLAIDPTLRPSAHRLRRHPYLTTIAPARAKPPADGDAAVRRPDYSWGHAGGAPASGGSVASPSPHSLSGGRAPPGEFRSHSSSGGGTGASSESESTPAPACYPTHGPVSVPPSGGDSAAAARGGRWSANPAAPTAVSLGGAEGATAAVPRGTRLGGSGGFGGWQPSGPLGGSADGPAGGAPAGRSPPLTALSGDWGDGAGCGGRTAAAVRSEWSIDDGDQVPDLRVARSRRDDGSGRGGAPRRRRPARVPLKRGSSLFGADRFVDSGQEGEYRRMWKEQAAHGVLASWLWPAVLVCLAAVDLRLLWAGGGGGAPVAALAAAAAAVYGAYPLARLVMPSGEAEDPEALYAAVLWWVRAVEAVGAAMSLRPDLAGGDLAVVLRMTVATLGGVAVKLSLTEHVAAVALTAAARVVAIAGGTLAGGPLALEDVPATLAAAVHTLCADPLAAGGGGDERQRATLAASSMLVLAAAAAASVLYAARAHAEARHRFRQELIEEAEAQAADARAAAAGGLWR